MAYISADGTQIRMIESITTHISNDINEPTEILMNQL